MRNPLDPAPSEPAARVPLASGCGAGRTPPDGAASGESAEHTLRCGQAHPGKPGFGKAQPPVFRPPLRRFSGLAPIRQPQPAPVARRDVRKTVCPATGTPAKATAPALLRTVENTARHISATQINCDSLRHFLWV